MEFNQVKSLLLDLSLFTPSSGFLPGSRNLSHVKKKFLKIRFRGCVSCKTGFYV